MNMPAMPCAGLGMLKEAVTKEAIPQTQLRPKTTTIMWTPYNIRGYPTLGILSLLLPKEEISPCGFKGSFPTNGKDKGSF